MEEPEQHEDDELLRRVVVVVEDHLVEARFFDLRTRFDREVALALGVGFLRVVRHFRSLSLAASRSDAVGATLAPMESLQDRYAPANACFGCGPANEKGLRIKSRVEGDEVVAEWSPEPHHEAFPGVLNGGIVGALLDCHSNWTAAWTLMNARGESTPPCTVTSDFHVFLKRPTPTNGPVSLRARAVKVEGDKVTVEATLTAGGKTTGTCTGTFVAVKEGHPAYHRW